MSAELPSWSSGREGPSLLALSSDLDANGERDHADTAPTCLEALEGDAAGWAAAEWHLARHGWPHLASGSGLQGLLPHGAEHGGQLPKWHGCGMDSASVW
jgi:hypothetical protein